MRHVRVVSASGSWGLTEICLGVAYARGVRSASDELQGVTVWDLFYVGLTIVVFAVLLLILKGIETFER
jgi:hypothetical protein